MSMSSTPALPAGNRIHWGRAIGAGLIATIVMTIVMVALKMNLVKSLGSMIVGSNASLALQYTVGGAIHLMIGIVYGIIFAALVARVAEWNRFIKGTVYGLAIAAIAFAAMPLMSAMLGGGGGAQNPCGRKQTAGAMNPCHPQAGAPMNPCHPKTAMNPCHPSGSRQSAKNPCHSGGGAGNPCNPCGGGGGGPWSGVISVVNHLVYALTLAFVYGKVR
ncbi:MAG TPA: hypothetical protein VGS96_01515 [Thermoanaerobaculia bacterium]|nr:hypothetical protein [Thermoanaerobaculia bacterium]